MFPSAAWPLVSIVALVPLWPSFETKEYLERATDVVIVRCLDPDPRGGPKIDGLTAVEVEILAVLKGNRKPGKAMLGTIGQPMEKGKRYLMGSFGGKFDSIDFLAQSEQAVTEIPADFDLKSIANKSAVDKAQAIFDARRADIERQLHRLQRAKQALEVTEPKGDQ